MINMAELMSKTRNCESCVTKPCQIGCPLNNDITGFIRSIKKKNYEEAYRILSLTTVLPALCGRICPHMSQCQGSCVKGVSYTPVEIGNLETFVGDLALEKNWRMFSPKTAVKKVAVIGGGPAGLTCAAFLRRNGIGVTIFEKYDYLGGILVHGIPEFRLPKTLVKDVTDRIVELGIEVEYNKELGKDIKLEDLEKEYDAVFIGIGANISSKMNIPGEDLNGVYGGNELLEHHVQLDYKGKTVIVSGGGNVAMDVCRTAKKNGAEKVYVVYRRSEKEMPAERKEIEEAKEEGVEFIFQNNIVRIIGEDNDVVGIELIKTELVQKEGETRLSPENIPGSNYTIDCDYVMMAVGSHPEEEVVNNLKVELDRKGKIVIDKNGKTSKENVFSGGDVAGSRGTVAGASRAGRDAAYEIIRYLKNKK